jgi:hypothetical protein
VRLSEIVRFINSNRKLPDQVDSSEQFAWYKKNGSADVTYDYFEHYDNTGMWWSVGRPINYHPDYQFTDYSTLDYEGVRPLMKKYFSPSVEVSEIVNSMEKKYSLVYENTCVLFYRGNDKNTETKKGGYDEYLGHANRIMKQNPNIVFLIQSDETGFIEFMESRFPNSSFCFKDEIRHMEKCNSSVDLIMSASNYHFSKAYLAITIIMSKCKYVICGSGNCDIWIMLYRGDNKNVIQDPHRAPPGAGCSGEEWLSRYYPHATLPGDPPQQFPNGPPLRHTAPSSAPSAPPPPGRTIVARRPGPVRMLMGGIRRM